MGVNSNTDGEIEFQMLKILTKETDLEPNEVTFDRMNIDVNPEEHIYIIDRNSRLQIDILTTKATRKTIYTVEWPSILHDGKFVSHEHRSLRPAMLHFAFALRMLNDVREAVHEVV